MKEVSFTYLLAQSETVNEYSSGAAEGALQRIAAKNNIHSSVR